MLKKRLNEKEIGDTEKGSQKDAGMKNQTEKKDVR